MAKAARKPAARPSGARLKVYSARLDGLNDYIVAAANQGEALKAWDVRQNLFREGLAEVTEDASALKAAKARPGVVLRRKAQSRAAWAEV